LFVFMNKQYHFHTIMVLRRTCQRYVSLVLSSWASFSTLLIFLTMTKSSCVFYCIVQLRVVSIMIKPPCVLCHVIIASVMLLAPRIAHRVFRLVSFCCSVKSMSGFCLHILTISNFIVCETFVCLLFFCYQVL
jgi:hypothetical protein